MSVDRLLEHFPLNDVLASKEQVCIPENYKNKPQGLYFSKALFEGLKFRGAYVRREIRVSKLIGLACSGKEIYHFA